MMNTERVASGRGSEENNESVVSKICMIACAMQKGNRMRGCRVLFP